MDEKVMDEKVTYYQICDNFGTVHNIAADTIEKNPDNGISLWCDNKQVAEFREYQWIKLRPETEPEQAR